MKTLTVTPLLSLKAKTVGLLNSQTAYPVYFRTRWGVHTYGMRYPIDIVVLDGSNTIVRLVHHFSPNRIFFWPPCYMQVLELPAGMIREEKISVGDKLALSFL